ncbi:hypothetical protein B0O80DRAFT_499623 [Mortierella sp. GBAus27b]|nr:hypothetical protein BGX31_003202 [Mortierella sp. GBA43]KAI8352323.1 hypothetical protein B0O80DRAFT_499623 [Mortierella sp. GBAus27b]
MFFMPEIDQVICQHLSQHDLAQCARVSKRWHYAVLPYLWDDLSCLYFLNRWLPFSRMVLDDYFHHHIWEQEDEYDLQQPTQHRCQSPCSSALKKYGPWIRTLPRPTDLFRYFQSTPSFCPDVAEPPTAHDLFHHLYNSCPSIQEPTLSISRRFFDSRAFDVIAQFLLPRVRQLHFRDLESWTIKYLLTRCSEPLEELTLDIDPRDTGDTDYGSDEEHDGNEARAEEDDDDDDDKVQDEDAEDSNVCWPRLKSLRLLSCNRRPSGFWAWIWKQCGSVERLETGMIDKAVLQSLARGMLTNMPNLKEVTLGRDRESQGGTLDAEDEGVATIIAGCRRGWRTVEIKGIVQFGAAAMDALTRHFSTLEVLELSSRLDPESDYLVKVLASCPNLRSLAVTDDDDNEGHTIPRPKSRTFIEADTFIDQNPCKNLLKPWLCEATLTKLSINIKKIPRPDLEIPMTAEEYPGRGREIQNLVYDRLARLANLETLCLRVDPDIVFDTQYDCLEMSLESGLHRLSGLKKIKVLVVTRLQTKIGVKEVRWMTEHWPKLHAIHGITSPKDSDDKEAVKWLKQQHPGIKLGW